MKARPKPITFSAVPTSIGAPAMRRSAYASCAGLMSHATTW